MINPITNSYAIYRTRPSFEGRKQLGVRFFRELKNVDCPYCGHKMLTGSQIDDYSQKVSKLKGVKLVKFIISLQPDMKPNEKKASCIIKEALKKYPHDNLKEVLGSFGCDEIHVFFDGFNIKSKGYHHDGTNYVEYREIRQDKDIDRLTNMIYSGKKITRNILNYYTKSLGSYIKEIYGW